MVRATLKQLFVPKKVEYIMKFLDMEEEKQKSMIEIQSLEEDDLIVVETKTVLFD